MSDEKPKNLYQKLAALSAEIGAVEKDGTFTGQGGYKFISHAQLMGVLRSKLAAHGLWIKPETIGTAESRVGEKAIRVTGVYKFTIINADDPQEREECIWNGEGIDYSDKATQKAGTSAMKYFLMKALNVSDKDDPDSVAVPVSEVAEKATRVKGLVDARKEPEEAVKADYEEGEAWDVLTELASSLPRSKGAPSWFPSKIKARIRLHGGGTPGYEATLKELINDHENYCGADCTHVAHPADVLAATQLPA